MVEQKGIKKKPTCKNMYQGVTTAGRREGDKIKKRGLCISLEKKKCRKSFKLANEIKTNAKKDLI